MVTSIAGAEVAQFLADATIRFRRDILDLDGSLKKFYRIRLGILALMIILAVAVLIFAGAALSSVFIIGGIAFRASRVCFYYSFKGKAQRFSRELAEWIKDNRGPLYAKGIRPRPGHGGVFILFEVNVVS
jgi:hypothetical protein